MGMGKRFKKLGQYGSYIHTCVCMFFWICFTLAHTYIYSYLYIYTYKCVCITTVYHDQLWYTGTYHDLPWYASWWSVGSWQDHLFDPFRLLTATPSWGRVRLYVREPQLWQVTVKGTVLSSYALLPDGRPFLGRQGTRTWNMKEE